MTDLSLEDQIRDAIIERFFAPIQTLDEVTRFSSDGSGNSWKELVPGNRHSPMQVVANHIYANKGPEIIAAVLERITLDEIVEAVVPKIVEQVVKTFDTRNDSSWQKPGEEARRKMNEAVWQRVADEFGRQAVAYLQATGGLQPVLGAVIESE